MNQEGMLKTVTWGGLFREQIDGHQTQECNIYGDNQAKLSWFVK